MRRLIFSVLVTILATVATYASRANSTPQLVRQPDGCWLTVTLYGDEHHHWMQTQDGTLVVHTGEGYYVGQIDALGRMTASDVLAHEPAQRGADELTLIAGQAERRQLFHAAGEQYRESRRAAIAETGKYVPHVGSPRVLVILTQFQDLKFSLPDPVKSFNQFFNSESETHEDYGHAESSNGCSVRSYFKTCSGGLFTPQFDVVGPVTVSKDMLHYGANNSSTDTNVGDLYTEAIQLVDDQVDFRDYVTDGSQVACVILVYAGFSESVGASSATIWPKTSSSSRTTDDGVTVRRFSISAELNGANANSYSTEPKLRINGPGVCIHEFSHAMGLPDTYPSTTDSRKVNNQTMEYWDLMDYGEYLNNGRYPTPYTAWEQETMGWLTVEELKGTQQGVQLLPVTERGDLSKAYKFGNGANSEEWFYVENIQQRGMSAKQYGHGLLVTHVAYKSSIVNMTDNPNNVAGTPRMTVVPADGLLISGFQTLKSTGDSQGYGGTYTVAEYRASLAGDPFPGTSGITQLTAAQELPNYAYYNGEATPSAKLTDIVEDTATGVITFNYTDSTSTAIRSIANEAVALPDTYHTLDGRSLSGQPSRPGVYLMKGRKVIMR